VQPVLQAVELLQLVVCVLVRLFTFQELAKSRLHATRVFHC
jgi:hypothetical protein